MVSYPILILVAVIAYVTGVIVGRRRPDRKVIWESARPDTAVGAPGEPLADSQRLALLEQNLLTPAMRGERQIAGPDLEELMILLDRKQLIPAIRRYRQLTGAGLKESKDAMEALQRTLPGPR